jgi:dTDP-4-dehydrorhamnose reductase
VRRPTPRSDSSGRAGRRAPQRQAPLEIWGGVECTVARIGERFRDQLRDTGHDRRPEDIAAIAGLGIRTLRYPVLWEQVAPESLASPRWDWTDGRLQMLRAHGIRPIAGLVHHGSGPRYTHLLDPAFPRLLADYAAAVAQRYPWLELFTPVNEPLTTARFSCLYGYWYPHNRDLGAFLRALLHECYGVKLAMQRIRAVQPAARLVQTEDVGKTYSTPLLAYQAAHENERRWLSFDLLCGRVDRDHPWHARFVAAGADEAMLRDLAEAPCPPDILGVNYYLSSERFLDQRRKRYPRHTWGGNGRHDYADVEALRIARTDLQHGLAARLREVWRRYRLPIAVTEVHNGCTREEQLRWLMDAHREAKESRAAGADIRALTVWSLFGAMDWNSMLTREARCYESAAFDVRAAQKPRATVLAKATSALAATGAYEHPVLETPGWWRRDMRFYRQRPGAANARVSGSRPLLVTGGTGTLGRAFERLCGLRGLACHLTSRSVLDIAEPSSVAQAIELFRPWAVINTAGYVRVADAERDADRCYRENTEGAARLAEGCGRAGIPFVSFSSDLVFDGRLGRAYLETDDPNPCCVYGISKARAEEQILRHCPQALIIRTSAFFGPWDRYNFAYDVLSRLAAGEVVTARGDVLVSPTYVPDLVHATLDLLIDGENGIWHLANSGATSWAGLAQMVASRAGLDSSAIIVDRPSAAPACTALGSIRGEMLSPLEHAVDRFFTENETAWAQAPSR